MNPAERRMAQRAKTVLRAVHGGELYGRYVREVTVKIYPEGNAVWHCTYMNGLQIGDSIQADDPEAIGYSVAFYSSAVHRRDWNKLAACLGLKEKGKNGRSKTK
jgi:phenolic acid decarboxylase